MISSSFPLPFPFLSFPFLSTRPTSAASTHTGTATCRTSTTTTRTRRAPTPTRSAEALLLVLPLAALPAPSKTRDAAAPTIRHAEERRIARPNQDQPSAKSSKHLNAAHRGPATASNTDSPTSTPGVTNCCACQQKRTRLTRSPAPATKS